MSRGDLRAAAAAPLQDGISEDESHGVTAVDLQEISDLRATCARVSAQWRQLQLALADNSINESEQFAEAATFAVFWREYSRICSAVITTRATTLAALFVKEEIVSQLVQIDGCCETSSFLMASFCDDFDSLVAGESPIGVGTRNSIAGVQAEREIATGCTRDLFLFDECEAFWAFWVAWDKTYREIVSFELSGSDSAVYAGHATLAAWWSMLEERVASLAGKPAMTLAGLLAKRKVLTVCLAFGGGVRSMPLLSASFLIDFGRLVSPCLADRDRCQQTAVGSSAGG